MIYVDVQTQSHITISISVVLLKDVSHPLETDASLDEKVEAQPPLPAAHATDILGKSVEEQLDKLRAEPVSESYQGVAKLGVVDAAALVQIEAVEQTPPSGQEAPQAAELVEADGAGAVRVEHAYHHAHRVRVESRIVSIDKGAAEGGLAELAGAVRIDCSEKWPQGIAVVAGRCRCHGGRTLSSRDRWSIVICRWGRTLGLRRR